MYFKVHIDRLAVWRKQDATRYLRWVLYHIPSVSNLSGCWRQVEYCVPYTALSMACPMTDLPWWHGSFICSSAYSCFVSFSQLLPWTNLLDIVSAYVGCLLPFLALPPTLTLLFFKVWLPVVSLPVSALSFLSGDRPPSFAPVCTRAESATISLHALRHSTSSLTCL